MIATLALAIVVARLMLGSGFEIPRPAGRPGAQPAPDVMIPPLEPEPARPFARSDDPRRAEVAAEALRPILTEQLAAAGLRYGDPVFLRTFKEERILELWVRQPDQPTYQLFRSYPIAAFSGGLGPKLEEGDQQAPEGFYFVPPGMMNPSSRFHLSFNLGYPNAYDRAHGRTGSALMIHGNVVSVGCYAMTDARIEEIYTLCDAALRGGQPFFRVHCFPFRMTADRMAAAESNEWWAFWRELQEGYELFESSHIPPEVSVRDQAHQFE